MSQNILLANTSLVHVETEAIYEFAINMPLAVNIRSCFPSGIPIGDPDSLAESNILPGGFAKTYYFR